MRNRLVIGNWKQNGSLAANAALLGQLVPAVSLQPGKLCGVCVPFAYLQQAQTLLSKTAIAWGAQDVSRFDTGAYTGDVSAGMVAEFGSKYAIIGHSERRAVFGDTDMIVAEKFARAMSAGLTPILCVGETLDERLAGSTEAVVARQLSAVVSAHGVAALASAVLAYEPVWAIGTGKTATPEEAEAVHHFLRAEISRQNVEIAGNMPILYGGSVKKANAKTLFAMPNVDGGLIGGASLVADEFLGIWQAL